VMRRVGDLAGVAGLSVARWLLRILIATVVFVVGLALAATSAQADVKSNPLGTSAGKVAGTATKAKAKVAARSTVPKVKIRVKAKAAPVRRAARKAAPVRTYRATRTTRAVVRKAAPVRTRISTVHRKTSPRPPVRAVRKAAAPKARQAPRAKTSPTKINSSPSKITKSSVRKATTVKRSPSTKAVKVAQTGPVTAKDRAGLLTQSSPELALTVPAVEVAGRPVQGVRVPAVVAPEIKVTVGNSVDLSAPPVGLRIPLLSLPRVSLPPSELPTVTPPRTELPTVALPRADQPTASQPVSWVAAAEPVVHQRAGPVDGAASGRPAQFETAQRPLGLLAGGSTVLTAYTALMLSLDAGVMGSIGPPAVVILTELGQRIRAMEIPASVGPTTALIIAAAIAAATGTASSGSAGGGGLAVVPTAFRLPALGGYRRLTGRSRESAFGTPRRPGFSPD
jgi:hypothetical protein